MAGSSNIDKLRTLIQKACDQLLTAADTMDSIIVEATGIGGKVSQIIPPHVQFQIDKITAIVDGDNQSALLKLDELIINMPYKDIAPQQPSDRREARKSNVDLTPNTSEGPQSTMKESVLSLYKKEPRYGAKGLRWDSLNESDDFRRSGDDMGLSRWTDSPLDRKMIRQKIRETIEDDDMEGLEDHLQESMDGKGHFDWRSMKSLSGSLDSNNISFSSLKEADDVSQANIVG